jgi:uncharacterized protein (DUF427 family)
MTAKQVLVPGPDHPITIAHTDTTVTVRWGDRVIAKTDDALVLRESSYRPVYYLPLDSIEDDVLEPSDHRTYCPYKGDASYYSLVDRSVESGPGGDHRRGGGLPVVQNAVWTYRSPYDAVSEIAGRVAFYPQHVEIRTD